MLVELPRVGVGCWHRYRPFVVVSVRTRMGREVDLCRPAHTQTLFGGGGGVELSFAMNKNARGSV